MASAYDPKVIHLLGAKTIVGTLTVASIPSTAHAVFDSQTTPIGTLVTAKISGPDNYKSKVGYLMRNRSGKWLIGYDTILAAKLAGRVTQQAQFKVNAKAATPSAKATRAGENAINNFRNLFVKG